MSEAVQFLRRLVPGVAGLMPAMALTFLTAIMVAQPASSQVDMAVLHAFIDGMTPNGLVQGTDGNFYGTTRFGGASGTGEVFKITPTGILTRLHSFSTPDGLLPVAGLVQGTDGNFYGTTEDGGYLGGLPGGFGTVFEMSPAGILTTLHTFSRDYQAYGLNWDGANPYAGLVQGTDGNFYGTTWWGGAPIYEFDRGSVFKITPTGTLTILHSFSGIDGEAPWAGLVQGTDGNFYGTTWSGGASNSGTVFKITAIGTLTTLHSFSGIDGEGPWAGLVQGTDGNFYGTTYRGGASNFGTVFKITPTGALTTLWSFSGFDGAWPRADLAEGTDGNFYGTTYRGGASDFGTVFKITPAGVLTTLWSFSGLNGKYPTAGLVQGTDGNFYGTTSLGGSKNWGVVFRLSVPLAPPLRCYTLSTSVSPSGLGSVTLNTVQNCAGGYTPATAISLTANVPYGYTFSGWSGTGGSFPSTTANPTTFTITANASVTASFTAAPAQCYALSTAASPPGLGSVTVTTGQNCAGGYRQGTGVMLTANVPSGYTFSGWSGTGGTFSSTTANPTTFTITGNASVTASFTPVASCYSLSVATVPVGVGSVSVATGRNCAGGYTQGTGISLTANGPSGYTFSGWSGTGGSFSSATANPTTFTLTGNASVTASFTAVSPPSEMGVSVNANPNPTTPGILVSLTADAYGGTGTYTSYSWNFGDGQRMAGPYPSFAVTHAYSTEGIYSAQCTVTDSSGATVSGAISVNITAQTVTYSFTHLAGSQGGGGWLDGTGATARFLGPSGVAVDGSGTVYVADFGNNTIRKVTPEGMVSTLAGLAGTPGSADGTGSAARFHYPASVGVDGSGNVYVADRANNTIRKVTPGGIVSTLAGLAGSQGSADGLGPAARFYYPFSVAVDASSTLYVADTYNHTIRKVTSAGVVSTLAGLAGIPGSADGMGSTARFSYPQSVAVDASGTLYVADSGNNTIRKVTPGGAVSTLAGLAGSSGSADGTGSAARFNSSMGIAVDSSGNVYVADNNTIRKVTADGVVFTLAGIAGTVGSADGIGSAARFHGPLGLAVGGSGTVYVADSFNRTIREVNPAGVVSTLAGLAVRPGSADGTGSAARFNFPSGVAVDASGTVYVADMYNNTIREVTADGAVSTLAGLAETPGSADGLGSAARFYWPIGVAVDGSDTLYVADTYNYTIRKVTSTGVVSTLAGLAGSYGSADGTGSAARFYSPRGIAVDSSGNVYVADCLNENIRVVTLDGVVSTLAGLAGTPGSADGTGSGARFGCPNGVAVDGSGNVYVADTYNYTIRKVTSTGVVSTLAGLAGSQGSADGTGSAARFYDLQGIAVDGLGNVYVVDDNTIRKVTQNGVVRTLAGVASYVGSEDGTGSAVRFDSPSGVAVDSSGNLYVADTHNDAVRKGRPPRLSGFVPIVLDAVGLAHYTSELQLTNLGASPATVKLSYTSSMGAGAGNVQETIPAGQQVVYPDAISYLGSQGVPIPATGNQGGTLFVFSPTAGVHATIRTGSDTTAPQPVGRAGLAYTDIDPVGSSSATKAYVYGLRTNDVDRSNLAVYNMGQGPVSLKVTLVSGDDGSSFEVTGGVPMSLPAYGWYQYSGVLKAAGFSSGYATIERVSGSGPFGAYGVVNDQKTNDGSFIPALSGTLSGSKLTIPVLAEAGTFESELILANRGNVTATFTLRYFESLSPAKGPGGTTTVDVAAGRQKIIPQAIDFLRSNGVSIGARGEAAYSGSLQIQVSSVGLENVFAGARTSSLSPAGGEFGVFYPAIDSGQEFSDTAFILGLKADVFNRSNVAAIHTGADGSGQITLEFQVLDGSEGATSVGQPLSVTLNPGEWVQPPKFFASGNVPNGYVRIRRTAGTAPWYAYGVINDGGSPGQRTGDGSYVPGVQP